MTLKLKIHNLETGEITFHHIDLTPTKLTSKFIFDRSTPLSADQECSIGRERTCNIVLSKASVSRQHAKIYRDSEEYYFVDLGSLGGSYCNDIKLTADRGKRMEIGSKIQIADFSLLVEEINTEPDLALALNNLLDQSLQIAQSYAKLDDIT